MLSRRTWCARAPLALFAGLPLVTLLALLAGLPLVTPMTLLAGLPLVTPMALLAGLPLVTLIALLAGLPLVTLLALLAGLPLRKISHAPRENTGEGRGRARLDDELHGREEQRHGAPELEVAHGDDALDQGGHEPKPIDARLRR